MSWALRNTSASLSSCSIARPCRVARPVTVFGADGAMATVSPVNVGPFDSWRPAAPSLRDVATRAGSVVVPVIAVLGVAVPVMGVVDVVLVRDTHVTAALAVLVVVRYVLGVAARLALVPVTVVQGVQVAVMGVVGVIAVLHRHVPAALAVRMFVLGVLMMRRCHGVSPHLL